eukprot:CAMPEP_0185210376 /NCGR_PEP_ID=MMETSP1140-20130426/65515_1 /TAXON_ID=298111 /ORGANISM="Pavlova sp., Strain CCMP459" /LENGTH=254 /DNA_ID=CAMNT_0027778181 /DNA_START=1 /DNA_END=762 /DNA_ORIENTATION=-
MGGRAVVVKERFPKGYRHPDIDQRLRTTRMSQEARMLLKARQIGLCVPAVYHTDLTRCKLYMEFVAGLTVKAYIKLCAAGSASDGGPEARVGDVAMAIGRAIARLHANHIVHGDLTTSNMVLRDGDPDQLVLIDFGLSMPSALVKDKAVDLYVCEKAFLSTHTGSETLFTTVLDAYAQAGPGGKEVVATWNECELADGRSLLSVRPCTNAAVGGRSPTCRMWPRDRADMLHPALHGGRSFAIDALTGTAEAAAR